MKRIHYFPWMGLVPVALGACFVYSLMIPVVGSLLFYLVPFAMVLSWWWLGRRCGQDGHSFVLSLLSGHWAIMLMALCAVWQFGLVDSQERIMFLAMFAQYLVGLVPGVLGLVVRLTTVDNVIDSTPVILWGSVASALALLAIFSLFYWLGRRSVGKGQS